jgi:phosphoglycolate phosphatase
MVVLSCHHHWLTSVDGIVFDKDGTLADSAPFLRDLAIARAKTCAGAMPSQRMDSLASVLIERFGVTPTGLTPDGLMAVGTRHENEQAAIACLIELGYAESTVRSLVPETFRIVDQQVVCKAAHTPPFPGTAAMLERLCQSSLKLAILSSDSTANVEEFLQYYSLDDYFDDWQGTDQGDSPKPDASLLKRVCNRLSVPPSRIVIIGDSWADQSLAMGAGVSGFITVSEAWGRSPIDATSLVLKQWDDLRVVSGGTI